MNWVLVVVVIYMGGNSAITSQKIEFETKAACKVAEAQVVKDLAGGSFSLVRASCVQGIVGK